MSGYGIKTYADLAETCGGMVLANEMAYRPMELVSGRWTPWEEIFQWYIVQDASFLMNHTDEPVFTTASFACTYLGSGILGRHGIWFQLQRFIKRERPTGVARNRCARYFFRTQHRLAKRRRAGTSRRENERRMVAHKRGEDAPFSQAARIAKADR